MDEKHVEALASSAVAQLGRAKEELLARMRDLGLTSATGWRISEELRHTIEGTEWIFRPVHLREDAPDLWVRVLIGHDGRLVE